MSNQTNDTQDSSSTHSAHEGDAFTDAQGQEDYDDELNPDEYYMRGRGYSVPPGADSNPNMGTDGEDIEEYSPAEEVDVEVDEHVSKSKKQRKRRSQNAIGTDRLVVTRVKKTGEPVSPWKKPLLTMAMP